MNDSTSVLHNEKIILMILFKWPSPLSEPKWKTAFNQLELLVLEFAVKECPFTFIFWKWDVDIIINLYVKTSTNQCFCVGETQYSESALSKPSTYIYIYLEMISTFNIVGQ